MMIGLGLGALVMATLEQRHQLAALEAAHSQYGPMPRSPATLVAWVVASLGVVVFLLVIFHQ